MDLKSVTMIDSKRKNSQENIVTSFDYSILSPEQRSLVEQRTSEIRELLRRTAQDIWEIGQSLAEVRAQLKHGQFETWLKAEFGWSRRTAYNFINVYETFGNRANLAQIDIATSALYLLAAPSTPENLRKQYIEEAKAGKRITHKELVQTIKNQQEKDPEKPELTPTSPSEVIAIIPNSIDKSNSDNVNKSIVEVPVTAQQIPEAIPQASNEKWLRLGKQHLIFHGDTASREFFANIPPIALAVAVTADDWDHEWLIEAATTLIVLEPSGLQANTLEQLITMFSQPGELVVFPWLPQADMIAIAHRLQRRVIAGDPSIELCQQAVIASGLSVEQI
jgi:DNA modification methylase